MAEEKRPDWMTSISATVDPEEYLLGRKIDKTFELSQQEKADKARNARIELLAKDRIKLTHDPILDLERRRRELKMEIIRNPVLLKQFRDKLLRDEREKERSSKPRETQGSEYPKEMREEDIGERLRSEIKESDSSNELQRSPLHKSPKDNSPRRNSSHDRNANRHKYDRHHEKYKNQLDYDCHASSSRSSKSKGRYDNRDRYGSPRESHHERSRSAHRSHHHRSSHKRHRDRSREDRHRSRDDHRRSRSRSPPYTGR